MSIISAAIPLEGIDDIQDFSWEETDEESSVSSELRSHINDLMQMGNKAYRENDIDKALECYTEANNVKAGNSVALGNRCSVYLRISHLLKHRPPSNSEKKPWEGLDPTDYAALALRDAEKVTSLQSNSIRSYILEANALVMLEKYKQARDVICSGLQIYPLSLPLTNLKRSLDNIFTRRRQVIPQRTDEYDCTVCLKLLYEPVTTPCGHSFCRACMFQALDIANRCPLCRRVLLSDSRSYAISVTLNQIIQKNFPEEYAERKMENDSLINLGVDLLPLFVLDIILPCQRVPLVIFEPRYKLMVRRIMEGNRRMGMTAIDPATGLPADYACEVEIVNYDPRSDGRIYIEVESRRRCRLIRNWVQDGYRIAEVDWCKDYPPVGADRYHLMKVTESASEFAVEWLKDAREAANGDKVKLTKLFKSEALRPPVSDPERFSFWLAAMTNRRPVDKLDLLRLRDTKERIGRSLVYLRDYFHGTSS